MKQKEEALRQAHQELLISNERTQQVLESSYRCVMEKRQVETTEFYSPRRQHWFELRVYPYINGISIYTVDITERKQNGSLKGTE